MIIQKTASPKRILRIAFYLAIAIGALLFLIGYILAPQNLNLQKIGEKLIDFGETIVFVGIIGGLIASGFHLFQEEVKREQEEQDQSEVERKQLLTKLQSVHDQVELARTYLRSHKSAKTYGEQIRQHIMPAYIDLIEIRRTIQHLYPTLLSDSEDELLKFRVSLHTALAYLAALLREYEYQYLSISNLQNYQEAVVKRMRDHYVNQMDQTLGKGLVSKEYGEVLQQADHYIRTHAIPEPLTLVWEKINDLPYLNDLITEIVMSNGTSSLYQKYFLKHYVYSKKLLALQTTKPDATLDGYFERYTSKLKGIDEQRASNTSTPKILGFTELIMERELGFVFQKQRLGKLSVTTQNAN